VMENQTEEKWLGGVAKGRDIYQLNKEGGVDISENVLVPWEELERGITMRMLLAIIGGCVIVASVLSVVGHSLLLQQAEINAQMSEERIISEIKREEFAIHIQQLSSEERLKYIAILSAVAPTPNAPHPVTVPATPIPVVKGDDK